MQGLGFAVSFAFLLSAVGMHTHECCAPASLATGVIWIALMLPMLGNIPHPYKMFYASFRVWQSLCFSLVCFFKFVGAGPSRVMPAGSDMPSSMERRTAEAHRPRPFEARKAWLFKEHFNCDAGTSIAESASDSAFASSSLHSNIKKCSEYSRTRGRSHIFSFDVFC
jgi:hypothetical protein